MVAKERYCVGKDLLYREVLMAPHGGGLHKQLIVPVKYREKLSKSPTEMCLGHTWESLAPSKE